MADGEIWVLYRHGWFDFNGVWRAPHVVPIGVKMSRECADEITAALSFHLSDAATRRTSMMLSWPGLELKREAVS